ncbi:hypothetical protein RCL1_004387 [Eukaryota sp. TZLM3-RCL]
MGNNISTFKESYPSYLSLAFKQLCSVSDRSEIPKHSVVDLTTNTLSTFDSSVFSHIKCLRLSRNLLTSFVFRSNSLAVLDISQNHISSFNINCPNLFFLDFSYNIPHHLSETSIILKTPKLKVLRGAGTSSCRNFSFLKNLPLLVFLDLTFCSLTSFHYLKYLNSLSILLLRTNPLLTIHIDSTLISHPSLSLIDATQCEEIVFPQQSIDYCKKTVFNSIGCRFILGNSRCLNFTDLVSNLGHCQFYYRNQFHGSNVSVNFPGLEQYFVWPPAFSPTDSIVSESLYDPWLSKVLGCVLLAATADALGTVTEFLDKNLASLLFPPVLVKFTDAWYYHDLHRASFLTGDFTDDTDHAVLLIKSFIENNGKFSHATFASLLSTWVVRGLEEFSDTNGVGLGRTIAKTVNSPGFKNDPQSVVIKLFLESETPLASNGALMRTYPVGIVAKSRQEAARLACEVASCTHLEPRVLFSCAVVSVLVFMLLREERIDFDDVFSQCLDESRIFLANILPDNNVDSYYTNELLEELELYFYASSFEELLLDDVKSMGFVLKTLGSALVSLRRSLDGLDSDQILSELIHQAGDADTNATVAGALLGARLGVFSINSDWKKLIGSNFLIDLTSKLVQSIK